MIRWEDSDQGLALHDKTQQTERELFAADDARHKAMVDNDLAGLDRLLAAELSYTHATARRETKAQYLGSLTRGRVRYLAVSRSDASVQVYGHVAVMIGKSEIRAISEGVPRLIQNLFQSVWVHSQASWRMAAWTSVLVPDTGMPGETP